MDMNQSSRQMRPVTLAALILVLVITCLVTLTLMGSQQQLATPVNARPSGENRAEARSVACQAYPFDQVPISKLRASSRMAFAFYFPPFPISIENADPPKDYYSLWLRGTDPRGYKIVDRPIPRTPLKQANWRQSDFETEVRQAIAMELDRFIWEHNAFTSDSRFQRLSLLTAAARAVDPNFRIMLSPDFPTHPGAKPDSLAAALGALATDPSLFRLADGRLLLAPFYPERQPPSFWKELTDDLSKARVKTALVPIFLSGGRQEMPTWKSISYGFSTWGSRWPEGAPGYQVLAANSHQLGRIFMSPVAYEDVRPSSNSFFEAHNSQELRASFDAARQGEADWLALITWNDYTESWMAPSANRGYAVADLSAYYIQWYKTGTAPTIKRDALYYFHRSQFTTAQSSGLQAIPNAVKVGGGAISDEVELIALLRSPGQIKIQQGDSFKTMEGKRGLNVMSAPLVAGARPVFTLNREGVITRLTSSVQIASHVTKRDLSYHAGSSISCWRG